MDLDETLVHTLDIQGDGIGKLHVKSAIRPHALELLRSVAVTGAFREVVFFTASTKPYADFIIDSLLHHAGISSQHPAFWRRLYRESCTFLPAVGKDLRKVTDDMTSVVLVDNTPSTFALQPANGLLVKSWFAMTDGSGEDDELARLRRFLLQNVATAHDVRTVVPLWVGSTAIS